MQAACWARWARFGDVLTSPCAQVYLAVPNNCPYAADGSKRKVSAEDSVASSVLLYMSNDEGTSFTEVPFPSQGPVLAVPLMIFCKRRGGQVCQGTCRSCPLCCGLQALAAPPRATSKADQVQTARFHSSPLLPGLSSWLGRLLGSARLGSAQLGLAWPGLAWLGLAWLGLAWLGLAWLGFTQL